MCFPTVSPPFGFAQLMSVSDLRRCAFCATDRFCFCFCSALQSGLFSQQGRVSGSGLRLLRGSELLKPMREKFLFSLLSFLSFSLHRTVTHLNRAFCRRLFLLFLLLHRLHHQRVCRLRLPMLRLLLPMHLR